MQLAVLNLATWKHMLFPVAIGEYINVVFAQSHRTTDVHVVCPVNHFHHWQLVLRLRLGIVS